MPKKNNNNEGDRLLNNVAHHNIAVLRGCFFRSPSNNISGFFREHVGTSAAVLLKLMKM